MTADIEQYQIMCNLCRYGPSPDGYSCIQAPQEVDQDMKFASFFTLLLDVKAITGDLQLLLKYWEKR